MQTRRERESVRDQSVRCEYSSLYVRHTFDNFSRENVRERHERTQSCAEKQSTDTRKRIETLTTEGRVTHSLYVNAAIPRREPSGPGKRRLPVGPFRRVRKVQGEVFEVFTGTTCSCVRCLRDVLALSLMLYPSSFTCSR